MSRLVFEDYRVINNEGIFSTLEKYKVYSVRNDVPCSTISGLEVNLNNGGLLIELHDDCVQLFKPVATCVTGDLSKIPVKVNDRTLLSSHTLFPFLRGTGRIFCYLDCNVAVVPLIHMDSVYCHFKDLLAVNLDVVGSHNENFNSSLRADSVVLLTQDKETQGTGAFVLQYKCDTSDLKAVNLDNSSIRVRASNVLMWSSSLSFSRNYDIVLFGDDVGDDYYEFTGTGKIIISTGEPI